MRVYNANMKSFVNYVQDKDLFIYGVGRTFQLFKEDELFSHIEKNIRGYIDNGKVGQIVERNGRYLIHEVDFLKGESGGIILLCGEKYMEEMFHMLQKLNLSDEFQCFILPLMKMITCGRDDSKIKKLIKDNCLNSKIEKRIHCCWFSGEKKPESYQKCIDSWKRVCPDYEIVEWNTNNYDIGKNTFIKQAYEKKKWAFVSDYARLDIIYKYGGIYLDMDVELLKRMDPFLQFSSFFSFDMNNYIDLGSGFGAIHHNPLILNLLSKYDDVEFLSQEGESLVDKYVQPKFVKDIFENWGVKMNGNMQLVDDMLVLPRKYYAPVDNFMLFNFAQCSETVGIHHYNAGWWSSEERESRNNCNKWLQYINNLL